MHIGIPPYLEAPFHSRPLKVAPLDLLLVSGQPDLVDRGGDATFLDLRGKECLTFPLLRRSGEVVSEGLQVHLLNLPDPPSTGVLSGGCDTSMLPMISNKLLYKFK